MQDDSDNDRYTVESEDNRNHAIDVEEDQEDYEDSTDNPVMVFEIYYYHHIINVWWDAFVKNFSDVL